MKVRIAVSAVVLVVPAVVSTAVTLPAPPAAAAVAPVSSAPLVSAHGAVGARPELRRVAPRRGIRIVKSVRR
jgi:hypothetical protein